MSDCCRRPQEADSDTALCVLPSPSIGSELIHVACTCRAMRKLLDVLRTRTMVVGTDAKMKVLTRGWSIISLGMISKKNRRETTFARDVGQGKCVQRKGTVCAFHPIVQAIAHTESQETYEKVFTTFMDLCDRGPSSTDAPLHTIQLHKDFAESAQKARRTLMPHARPMNDWAHFLRKVQRRLPKKTGSSSAFGSSDEDYKVPAHGGAFPNCLDRVFEGV